MPVILALRKEVEVGGSGVQYNPCLYSQVRVHQGYKRHLLKKQPQPNEKIKLFLLLISVVEGCKCCWKGIRILVLGSFQAQASFSREAPGCC